MSSLTDSNPPQRALVWLTLAMTVQAGDPAYEQFRSRLNTFLHGSGIAALLAGDRLALLGTPAPVPRADKALVMHWLMQQPEVIVIIIRRESLAEEACHGQA